MDGLLKSIEQDASAEKAKKIVEALAQEQAASKQTTEASSIEAGELAIKNDPGAIFAFSSAIAAE